MRFANIKMVLFDLDGTLVDSVPDIALGVDGMMTELGLEPPGIDKVRRWVGNGMERLVKRALTGDLEDEPDKGLFERALPAFRQNYSENNGRFSRLYPGVRETLRRLAERKIAMACVTNKAESFSVPLLKVLGIAGLFGLVVSGDSLSAKKPDPMPLLHAAKHFNLEAADCLMVGDSVNDVKAARKAGFPVVAVSYGYNYGEDIHAANPDAVIDNFDELTSLLI
jgi:phosphoglycolate phosphatase